MSAPKQVVRMVLAGLTCAALATATGCGSANGDDSGPTAAEAGTQLAKDAKSLLDQVQDHHNLTTPYTVTEDATKAVPCGENKAKRTFAARTRIPVGADLDTTLDLETTGAAGALPREYKIAERSHADDLSGRKMDMRNDENGLVISVQLTPSGRQIDYAVTGETRCLSGKS
jgi:hypothetical protein